jgi:hypothetical protein
MRRETEVARLLRVLSPSPPTLGSWLASSELAPDSYLTDGDRLFRLASRFDPAASPPLAMLEDCRTLEVETYLPYELCSMRLRLVRAAGRG